MYMDIEKVTEKTLELGKLSLLFSRVNRATFHEDGVTPESDTDHTVMLGLCACAFASQYDTSLDIGKVAQFALVHDLVEAYAGDTNSIGITADTKSDKEVREHNAFLRIQEEFRDIFPWIHSTIEEYESLESKEARFIKTFDKILPKITHTLNNGKHYKDSNRTKDELASIHQKQVHEMSSGYAKEFTRAIDLLKAMMKKSEETIS